jgi:hypothetical protein
MFRSRWLALGVFVALVVAAAIGTAAVQGHGDRHHGGDRHGHHHGKFKFGFPPNVDHFNLDGYKIEAKYTLGRNTGNTFDQTYGATQVQGVPVAGPNVGTTFPPADYIALQIAPKTLYIVWQNPANDIIDAFVMNFKTHVVFDFAPGSDMPESSGTVKILQRGSQPIR